MDPRNQDSWCIGTIIDKDGPRLRIRLDGTDDRNDFWQLVDSANIRSYGTTAKLVGKMNQNSFIFVDFLGWTNCTSTRFSTKFKSMAKIFRKEYKKWSICC